LRFQERATEDKNVNSPQLGRAAVREAKLHGVDWIKIYTTQDFVGQMHMWRPDATLVNSPSLSFDEVNAIVDESHRLGLKVVCHTYGGEGMFSCLNAGVDAPNHLLELDETGIKILLDKKLTFVPTIDDLMRSRSPTWRKPAVGTRGSSSWSRPSGGRSRPASRWRSAAARPRRRSRTASRATSSAIS